MLIRVIVPNFIEIGQSFAELWRFFDFPRWRSSAILDLLVAYLHHSRIVFGGLYQCAKFGWNLLSNFDNMKISIFYEFGLKTPIHGPKMGVLKAFDPLNGEKCYRHPQKAHPCVEPRRVRYFAWKSVQASWLWMRGRTQKKTSRVNHFSARSHACAETKPLIRSG